MASIAPPVSSSRDVTEPTTSTPTEISLVIETLKKTVDINRGVSIQKRMEENKEKLNVVTKQLFILSHERTSMENNLLISNQNLLTKRQMDVIGMHNGFDVSNGDKNDHISTDDGHVTSSGLVASTGAARNPVRAIKLPEVKKLPPYTTWIFLDRNQRMTEDQSVVGRRRIYYDQTGGEALICSDSEEEVAEDDEEKREFVESEDYILRMTVKEVGSSEPVMESLAKYFSRSVSEVKARIDLICKEEVIAESQNVENEARLDGSFYEKDLEAALDSFDNLFCRRCLVFDCRLHGCSQDLIFPVEKPSVWSQIDNETASCGPQCYKLILKTVRGTKVNPHEQNDVEDTSTNPSENDNVRKSSKTKPSGRRRLKSSRSESALSNAKSISESSDSEMGHHVGTSNTRIPLSKTRTRQGDSKRVAEHVINCMRKRQKKTMTSDSDSVASAGVLTSEMKLRSSSRRENEDSSSSCKKTQDSRSVVQSEINGQPSSSDDTSKREELIDEQGFKVDLNDGKPWKSIEKSLFEKGVEIFGGNSCLIARNLLNGLKTCWEIFQYMTCASHGLGGLTGGAAISHVEGFSVFELNGTTGNEVRRRSRFLRRRGRVRRLKYSWKSTSYHSIRKRISERKDQPCRQYNPCSCQTACGKECPCHLNGTCCEKYCGCLKSCKNRFRGCHCAKSQCRSRQCPCFAADRECDPDVCRNCWVSCGDGTLGFPGQRGDNYECRNMKLLLKQQQRVLLGRSDVSGWGAFLKNSVAKHEYLGEYTGELISHREADKRGKIYDRENSSFLFNLNDQFVLDAYRKGDKLKFANHSPDPNCYAKVIMVTGDHRVGIFAKERICSGEELFYDYRYEPDRAPAWARKPEASGTKKEETGQSSGRAKKLA